MNPALAVTGLVHAWPGMPPGIEVPEFRLDQGARCALMGDSGAGKTTFLDLIAGLRSPAAGIIRVDGNEMTGRSRAARDRLRADRIGVVFQQLNLLSYLDVVGNVELPCTLSAWRRERAQTLAGSVRNAAETLLERLGIERALWSRRSDRLSVGQQQRVAIARALIGAPRLILADEPTAALDRRNRDAFLRVLMAESERVDAAVLLVTHDAEVARCFPLHAEMVAGRLRALSAA